MDSGIAQIIVALITVCVPALVTLITTKSLKKQNSKNAARHNILQLIFEDKVRALEGYPPENYQAILDEYDDYKNNGGNSYIVEKVDDYKKWHSKTIKKGKTKKVDK